MRRTTFTRSTSAVLAAILIFTTAIVSASPPPNVSIVFHNETGSPVSSAFGTVNWRPSSGTGSNGSSFNLGAIGARSSATASLRMAFSKTQVTLVDVGFTISGRQDRASWSSVTYDSWDKLACTSCPNKYKITWTDATIHFYLY